MKKFKLVIILITTLISVPVVMAGSTDPIITQGSSSVSQQEFDGRISRIPQKDRLSFLRDGSRVEKILRQLIMDRRIADEARKTGFENDPLVQQRLKLAMDSELAKAWLDSIQAQQLNAADFQQMAKEYYLTHKNTFKSVESIDVAHILVGSDNRTEEAAKKLSAELYARLIANPGLWEELVIEYSDDPGSKSKGGKYLAVVPGKMVKAFEDTAFAIQNVGEIASPVKTQFGYHIIRLDAHNPAATIPFEEVEAQLTQQQQQSFAQKARVDYISGINTMENLVIPDCAVEEMMLRYFDDNGVKESYQECLAGTASPE